MVKYVKCLIKESTLVDFIKKNIEGYEDCKDLIITNAEVSGVNSDEIAFEMIVSDEFMDRDFGFRFVLC